jgi:chromosome segregation ATPase
MSEDIVLPVTKVIEQHSDGSRILAIIGHVTITPELAKKLVDKGLRPLTLSQQVTCEDNKLGMSLRTRVMMQATDIVNKIDTHGIMLDEAKVLIQHIQQLQDDLELATADASATRATNAAACRERDEAREAAESLRASLGDVIKERDQAQAEVERVKRESASRLKTAQESYQAKYDELEAKLLRSEKHFEETTDKLMAAAGVDVGEFKSDGEYSVEDMENVISAQVKYLTETEALAKAAEMKAPKIKLPREPEIDNDGERYLIGKLHGIRACADALRGQGYEVMQ